MPSDFLPPRPSGSTREALFDQSLHDKVHGPSAHINSTSTVKVEKTTKGYRLHAKPPKRGSSGATLDKFYYQSSMGNYIWCTDVKLPPAVGVTPVYTAVAKVPKLRNSIASEVIDGVTVSYAYTAYTTAGLQYLRRDATIPGNSVTEKQDINPRFIANDLIHAMKATGGSGIQTTATDPRNTVAGTAQAIDYIDINLDARAWTQRDDQST